MDEWVSNSSEALEISLVQPAVTGLRTIASFQPQFTYPIFGDEETIFGYQNLKIHLLYNASDMRPNLRVSYGAKLPVGGNEATDIPEVLKEFLPPVAFQKPKEFEAAIRQTPTGTYRPPGERLLEYTSSDGRYEIWKGSLDDAAVKQLVNRLQIFVPLFIEGGTFIETDGSDVTDRWTVFFLFRTRQLPGSADAFDYEFAGYSTVYRFILPVGVSRSAGTGGKAGEAAKTEEMDADFMLPIDTADSEPAFALSKLPCRSRLSQFLILPPFQGKGNAGRLYGAIFAQYLKEPQTVELTVEDPNEAFDDVRDLADLKYLDGVPAFKEAVRINTAVVIPKTGPSPRNIVDQTALDAVRRQTKIAPRQFNRLVEMYLMYKLAPSVRPTLEDLGEADEADEEHALAGQGQGKSSSAGKAAVPAPTKEEQHAYKLWRLFVKQRLYRHNKEILGQLDRSQRIDKLEETLVSVELEYARILSVFETRSQKYRESGKTAVSATKRRLADEEENDGYGSSTNKKARTD